MNQTNRELLELAAKAAGYMIVGWNDQHGVEVAVLSDGSFWQPLSENKITDCMGDALRLAIKLRMFVDTDWNGGANAGNAEVGFDEPEYGYQEGAGKQDRYAATRRVIVRAAAAIGEAQCHM